MVSTPGFLLALVSLLSTSTATAASVMSTQYTNVPGFFAQDEPETNASTFDFIASNFGLLDSFNVEGLEMSTSELRNDMDTTGKAPWGKFRKAIEQLNQNAPRNTTYRVMFLARHGEGFHNVAESFYGTPEWNCYWSLQDGNGTIEWGPDALLTQNGINQARAAHGAWKTQLDAGAPLPQSFYSSPLSRAARTLEVTWDNITLGKEYNSRTPVVKELWRETIGLHTCDKRRSKTYIEETFPEFNIEKGFAEEDPLWTADLQESNSARDVRMKKALDEIFTADDSTYISVSSHSGALSSVLKVIGHRDFGLATGAMIPVVLKVEYRAQETPTSTSVAPGVTAPACSSSGAVASATAS